MSEAQDLLAAVETLVSTDDPWTSRRELRQHAANGTSETLVELSTNEVSDLINQLVLKGELVYWHGLVTLPDDDYTEAAIEHERQADSSRKLLIGKLNKIRSGEWDFSAESPAPGAPEADAR